MWLRKWTPMQTGAQQGRGTRGSRPVKVFPVESQMILQSKRRWKVSEGNVRTHSVVFTQANPEAHSSCDVCFSEVNMKYLSSPVFLPESWHMKLQQLIREVFHESEIATASLSWLHVTSHRTERNYEQPRGGKKCSCHEVSEISDSSEFLPGKKDEGEKNKWQNACEATIESSHTKIRSHLNTRTVNSAY